VRESLGRGEGEGSDALYRVGGERRGRQERERQPAPSKPFMAAVSPLMERGSGGRGREGGRRFWVQER
jgi:hypothetical protein